MPDNGFVNLHNHSDYSILDGYSHPGEYVKRAAELGQTAVGLTDHGNLFGAFDFIKSARNLAKTYDRKNHPQTPVFIKPIIGIEAYMAPQNPDGAKCKSPVLYSPELRDIIERKKQLGYTSRKRVEKLEGDELQLFKDMEARERELRSMDVSSRGAYTHLTLIAINDVGFHNLIHLTTEASKREHYYQHGRMDFDMLTKWNEGIIATTGCPSGEIQTRLRLGQKDEAYDYARRMAELFKDRYYVELMLHNMPSDLESSMIPKLKQLADDLDLPLLATNDSHYARPEDAIHHEEMLCVQTNSRGGGEGGKGFVTMNCLKNDDPAPDRMISVRQKDGSYKQVAQPRRFAFQGDDYYLKTYDEMIKAFPEDEYPGAVSNTVKIADMVGDWWMKPGVLDLEKLEADYKAELGECRNEVVDSEGHVTLPHATGGRTNRLEEANKGFVALGDTPDPTDVTGGFDVDPLAQKLIDDGKITIGAYDLSLNTDLRPEIQIPEGWTEEEWFKKKINEGFIQRRVAMGDSDEILEDSKRRIADEYPVFAGKNFIQYMLVVQDYINWAREHGVSVGEGRGCFLPDSAVMLEDGNSKPIQNVEPGDYVLTNNGSSQGVLDSFRYDVHAEDCVNIKLSNGKTIKCTADHMLYVDKVGFVKACDLKPGCVLSGRTQINDMPERRDSSDDVEEDASEGSTERELAHVQMPLGGMDALTPYLNGETLGGIDLNSGVSLSLKDPEDPVFVGYDSWCQLRMINLLEMDSDVRSYSRLGGVEWSTDPDGHSRLHGLLPMFLVLVDDGTDEGSTRVIALNEEADSYPLYQSGLDWAESQGITVEEWTRHDIESMEDHCRSYASVVSVEHFEYDGPVYDLHVDKVHNYTIEGVTVHNSVGGSEIAYLMDISRTDPVRHDLLFERFLNPERNSPPDVDTDFKASVRNRVLQYAKDKYGYDKVANIITFGTFQFKQAFRDVAKIYQMTNSEVDRISKLIPDPIDRVAPTMHDLYDPKSPFYAGAADFREMIASNKDWEPIIDSTDKISGRVRQTGTHACGVIMSSKPISDYAPLFWTPDEKKAKANIWTDCMVGWEYPDLESIGLIKMDFLPLSTLDLIDDTIDNIKSYNDTIEELAKELEEEGESGKAKSEEARKLPVPNLDNIEVHGLEDENTFKMLASGDSDAVFQLGSDGQKALLRRIEPDQFEDIVAINALYRPGPMGMNAHLEYADRKNGRAPAYIIDEKLDKVFRGTPVADVLGPTYGLCVPAGTPILDCTTGEYVPIEEFPIGHKTISFNEETNEWNNNEVSDVFHTGKHDIVRITTRNHKVVEVADTHPLLTQRGWVRAGELLESDSLVMNDGGMDEIPNGSGLTPDLAWFLGVMLGDGSMTGGASVIIITADQPIINEVERIMTDNFDNIDVEIKVRSNKNVKYINLCNRDRVAQGKYDRHKVRGAERNQVNQFLSRYGYNGKILMYDKTLTDEVLRSSNEILAHIVAGLWDTDGTCKKNGVHYTTTAPGLYHGMRLMLDRIGVKYGVMETPYHNEKRLDRTAYRIYPDMEDFDRKIVPLLRLKGEDFKVSQSLNMNPDRIPRAKDPVRFKSEIIDACKAWIKRDTDDPLAVEAKRLADAKRKKYSSGWMLSDESFCNDILRKAARNLGMEIPSEHTTGDRNKAQDLLLLYPKAITPDLRKKLDRSYSPITSIQIVGEHECWDMTVENDHTYMINGFIGHNCIYQESVMQISRFLCGFTRGQADSLRKAIGHKIPEEMEANHKRFVDGAMRLKEKNGWIFSRSDVEALWSYIEKFASYGFNRSHSVSYAIDAYKTAYLKANYYPFFMASCMTADLNNKDKFAVYLRNVENRGLKVGPININHSNKGIQAVAKKSPDDPDIVFGFDKATGVNAELADEITRTREKTLKGEFKSFDEFMMNMSDVNAGALTGLANAGAFDDFGIPRKAIAKNAKDIVEFYKKKRNAKKQVSTSLFGMLGGANASYDAMGDYDFKLSGDPSRDEYSLTSKLKAEKDSLSVYVSASPMSNAGLGLDVMRRTPYYWRAITVEEVSKLISENASVDGNNNGKNRRFFRRDVRMIGWFSDLTYKKYRSGNGVFFMGTFTDKTGNLAISVNGEPAEQMAAAVGLRPLDDNPLDGKFPVPTFYKSGELNTVKRGGSKLTVDEQVERLTDVLVDVTMQITNDRVKVKTLDLVPTTPDGRVPLTLRLKSDRGVSNSKFLEVLEIMRSHPGDVPVVVDVQNMTDPSSHPTLMGVPVQAGPNNVLPFGVDLSEEMINEVSKLRDPDDFFMSWSVYEAAAPHDPIHQ